MKQNSFTQKAETLSAYIFRESAYDEQQVTNSERDIINSLMEAAHEIYPEAGFERKLESHLASVQTGSFQRKIRTKERMNSMFSPVNRLVSPLISAMVVVVIAITIGYSIQHLLPQSASSVSQADSSGLSPIAVFTSTPVPSSVNQTEQAPPLATLGNGFELIKPENAAQLKAVATIGSDYLQKAVFSSDGKLLAVIYSTHIALLEGEAWSEIGRFPINNAPVANAIFSPDSQLLALMDTSGSIALWQVSSLTLLCDFDSQANTMGLGSLTFTPDGQTLITAWGDGTIERWQISDRTLLQTWRLMIGENEFPGSIALSPDGMMAAFGLNTGAIRLWGFLEGEEYFDLEADVTDTTNPSDSFVDYLQFSADGALLASHTYNNEGRINLWRVSDGAIVQGLNGLSVSIAPDGKSLAYSSDGNTLQVMSLTAEDSPRTLVFLNSWGASMSFSPDGSYLAAASYDTLNVWSLEDGKLLANHRESIGGVAQSTAFSPDGKKLAVSYLNGGTWLWQIADRTLLHIFQGEGSSESIAFSPDNTMLAVGGDGDTQIWRIADGSLLQVLTGHFQSVSGLAFSPDNSYLATSSSYNGTIKLWRVSDGALMYDLNAGKFGASSVAFSPDGQYLAATGVGNLAVKIWRVTDGSLAQNLETTEDAAITDFAFLSGGEILAATSNMGFIWFWKMPEGELVTTINETFYDIAVSPDSQIIAGIADDGLIHLVRVSDGETLAVLPHHNLINLAFSPDGMLLASVSENGSVELWGVYTP